MLGVSSAAHAFCDSRNRCWVSIDAVARLLEEGRIVKSIRQVEKCILIPQSTGLPQVPRVLLGLSETSLVGFGPLLFHPRQDTALLPLGVPIGTSSVRVVFIVRGVYQRQRVVSQGIALTSRCSQSI